MKLGSGQLVTCVAASVDVAVVAGVVGEGDDVEDIEQLADPGLLGCHHRQADQGPDQCDHT